jgi:hypothetical protein
MSTRTPLFALAVIALTAAALLWLTLWQRPEVGAVVAPSAPEDGAATDPAVVAMHPVESADAPATASDSDLPEVVPPRATRESVPARTPWSAPLRGHIEDARTGDPVPYVLVATRTFASNERTLAMTDAEGRFETPSTFSRQRLKLRARDSFSNKTLDDKTWEHGFVAEECHWRVELGPTYRVRLHGGDPTDTWSARLIERGPDGNERTWPKAELQAHPSGVDQWIRYPEQSLSPDSSQRPALQVFNGEETWRGEALVQSTVGVHPDILAVVVAPHAGAITGRVTDSVGEPVDATVQLLIDHPDYRDEQAWRDSSTDDGRYRIDGLPAGVHRLTVTSETRAAVSEPIEVVLGLTLEHDILLSDLPLAGDISGWLVGPPGSDDPQAFVHLHSTDGGGTHRVQFVGLFFNLFGSGPEPTGRSEFLFEDLPPGEYRLSVTPFDGRRYDRTALELSPPAADVLFTTDDDEPEFVEYELIVTNAETGVLLDGVSLLLRIGGFWTADVGSSDGLESGEGPAAIDAGAVVAAPGYRPVYVTLDDGVRTGDTLKFEVALEPGFGAAFIVADGDHLIGGMDAGFSDAVPGPGLSGAEILVAGRVVGRSDANGLALVASEGPISHYDVRLRGWKLLTKHRFRNHEETPDGIGFVLLTRD